MAEPEQLSPGHWRFPVAVLMERVQVPRGRWQTQKWRLVGVVAGARVAGTGPGREQVFADERTRQYRWTGLAIDLYRDAAEDYWYNLSSEAPAVFVVCQGEDEDLAPRLVTVNQDEALAHMESEDAVFSVAIPAEIHQWLERYVVEHYVPAPKKKRRRIDWAEDSKYASKRERDPDEQA